MPVKVISRCLSESFTHIYLILSLRCQNSEKVNGNTGHCPFLWMEAELIAYSLRRSFKLNIL